MLADRVLRRREQAGRADKQAEWEEWNRRRMEAENRGEKFDEPPPIEPKTKN